MSYLFRITGLRSQTVSDKSCIRISPVVPKGIPVSDKSCIKISPVVPTGILVSDKSCI